MLQKGYGTVFVTDTLLSTLERRPNGLNAIHLY